MNKRYCILVFMMSISLSTLLLTPVTTALYPPRDEYDSFCDISSANSTGYPDGRIDLWDLMLLAIKYGTEGNPQRNVTFVDTVDVNVTNWPGTWPPLPQTGEDVAEINVLGWTSVQVSGIEYGIEIRLNIISQVLPFGFSPKGQHFNATGLWIIITEAISTTGTTQFDIVLNDNKTITTPPSGHNSANRPAITMVHRDDAETLQLLQSGVNTLEFRNVQGDDSVVFIFRVDVLIEYEYST